MFINKSERVSDRSFFMPFFVCDFDGEPRMERMDPIGGKDVNGWTGSRVITIY